LPSPEDRRLIERQKVCPVTGESLDAMGGPVRIVVDGRTVFVCCAACEKPLRKSPQKYLSKLPR
jgi:Cu(I)/Ag(I) efflux system membrane fusion protein